MEHKAKLRNDFQMADKICFNIVDAAIIEDGQREKILEYYLYPIYYLNYNIYYH